MVTYAIPEAPLDHSIRQPARYSEQPPPARLSGLEEVVRGKTASFAAILDQIVADISAREDLSRNLANSIQQHSCVVSTELLNLPDWSFDLPLEVEHRRSALEQQLDTLLAEERRERVDVWRDVARLKAEFRSWLKQFADAAQRAKVVLPYSDLPTLQEVLRSIEK